MMKNSSIIGMALGNCTEREMKEIFEELYEGLKTSVVNPTVGKSFSLEEAPDAHVFVIERPTGTVGNVVLLP